MMGDPASAAAEKKPAGGNRQVQQTRYLFLSRQRRLLHGECGLRTIVSDAGRGDQPFTLQAVKLRSEATRPRTFCMYCSTRMSPLQAPGRNNSSGGHIAAAAASAARAVLKKSRNVQQQDSQRGVSGAAEAMHVLLASETCKIIQKQNRQAKEYKKW